jgi:DNA ligase (NAD+)
MMSLDNAFTFEELVSWGKRMERYISGAVDYVCELKIDGIAISLLYEDGRYVRAATGAGDGKASLTLEIHQVEGRRPLATPPACSGTGVS